MHNETAKAPRNGLGDAAFSGARWFGLARLLVELSTFAATVIVARLLTPQDFGLVVVATVLAQLALALTAQGFGAPVVQAKSVTAKVLRPIHGVSCLAGVTFGTATATAGFVLTENPSLRTAYVLAGLCFALSGASAVPIALLQRDLAFKRLGILAAVGAVAGQAGCVLGAASGLGPASLVLPVLGIAAAQASILASATHSIRPSLAVDRDSRQLLRFGFPVAGSGLLFFGTRNVDSLVIAANFPPSAVGQYLRAFQYGSEYQGKLSTILQQLALPLFARADSGEQLRSARRRMTQTHAAVVLPLQLVLLALAPGLIVLLFGAAWEPAVDLARVLCVIGIVNTIATGAGPLLIAAGHPKALLGYNAVELMSLTIAVLIGAQFGLLEACVAVALSRVVTLGVLQRMVIQPRIGIPARETLWTDLVPGAVSGALAAGASSAAFALAATSIGPAAATGAGLLAATLAYGIALTMFFPRTLGDLQRLAKRAAQRTAKASDEG